MNKKRLYASITAGTKRSRLSVKYHICPIFRFRGAVGQKGSAEQALFITREDWDIRLVPTAISVQAYHEGQHTLHWNSTHWMLIVLLQLQHRVPRNQVVPRST